MCRSLYVWLEFYPPFNETTSPGEELALVLIQPDFTDEKDYTIRLSETKEVNTNEKQ